MSWIDWSFRREGHVDTGKVVEDSILLFEELLDWFSSLNLVSEAPTVACQKGDVYVDEGF